MPLSFLSHLRGTSLYVNDKITCKNLEVSEGFKLSTSAIEGYVLQTDENGEAVWANPSLIGGEDNVIATNDFGTDNRLTRTVGTGKEIEATDIIITDTNDISEINNLSTNNLNVSSNSTIGGGLDVSGNTTIGGTLSVSGVSSLNNLTLGSGTSSYSFPPEIGEENQILSVNTGGGLVFTTPTGGGGGSSIVASFVDNSYTINKPSAANLAKEVTEMSYEMEVGKTYYVKMFIAMPINSNSGFTGLDNSFFPLILSHIPWAATSGQKEGFIGTRWMDDGNGTNSVKSSADTTYIGTGHDPSASQTNIIASGGFGGYAGWAKIEGMITAPSTATFTPTLSLIGGGSPVGSITISFQGMILEMP